MIICQLQLQVAYDLCVNSFPSNQENIFCSVNTNADAVLKVRDNWMIGEKQQKIVTIKGFRPVILFSLQCCLEILAIFFFFNMQKVV